MPNPRSGPSQRTFLGSTAVATAAVGGLALPQRQSGGRNRLVALQGRRRDLEAHQRDRLGDRCRLRRGRHAVRLAGDLHLGHGRRPGRHLRLHRRRHTWIRINDDEHQWVFAESVITGDPHIYGRVYLSARGLIYGDIAD
ncbi:hypothetical protein [Saccharothrix sp. ALI-22-I]|uniref:hypothetical protein n=1 Tax=Saccharothrix sp. ALI-22-I TaxID=1933778 RepID=UPI00117A9C10|nr:hypothetical protein [Saccharothrix sp. ALI-22-I]